MRSFAPFQGQIIKQNLKNTNLVVSPGHLLNSIHSKAFEYAGFLYTKQKLFQTLRLSAVVPKIQTIRTLLFFTLISALSNCGINLCQYVFE